MCSTKSEEGTNSALCGGNGGQWEREQRGESGIILRWWRERQLDTVVSALSWVPGCYFSEVGWSFTSYSKSGVNKSKGYIAFSINICI